MITEMHHTGFVVEDLEKAVNFYHRGLGLEEQSRYEREGPGIDNVIGYRGAHIKICLMSIGSHSLELIQYLNPDPANRSTTERNVIGGTHLAFQVEDIYSVFQQAMDHGAVELNPPTEVAPGRTACYLQDPEGNWIEFIEIK